MKKTNTVLILGAGASVDFGYPLGNELKERVAGVFDEEFRKQLRDGYGFRPGIHHLIDKFIEDLSSDRALTIDRFLAKSTLEYKSFGKVAITKVIMDCEDEDQLFKQDSWYNTLYSIINEYPMLEGVSKNKLSVVTFNYDRSLEHFLYQRLLDDYGDRRHDEVVSQLGSIPIIHVHGRINPLPWEDRKQAVEYGRNEFVPDIFEIGKQLRLPGETNESLEIAQQRIDGAEVIYFLGFGYDQSNSESLGVDKIAKCKNIFGTSFKLPIATQGSINALLGRNVIFSSKTLEDFMMNEFNPDGYRQ